MRERFVKALMAGGLLATMIVTGIAAAPAAANDGSTKVNGAGPTCVVSTAPADVTDGKRAEFGTSTMVENGTPAAGAKVVDCGSVPPPPGLDKQSYSAGGGAAGVLTTCMKSDELAKQRRRPDLQFDLHDQQRRNSACRSHASPLRQHQAAAGSRHRWTRHTRHVVDDLLLGRDSVRLLAATGKTRSPSPTRSLDTTWDSPVPGGRFRLVASLW